jgi:hypothetical protein
VSRIRWPSAATRWIAALVSQVNGPAQQLPQEPDPVSGEIADSMALRSRCEGERAALSRTCYPWSRIRWHRAAVARMSAIGSQVRWPCAAVWLDGLVARSWLRLVTDSMAPRSRCRHDPRPNKHESRRSQVRWLCAAVAKRPCSRGLNGPRAAVASRDRCASQVEWPRVAVAIELDRRRSSCRELVLRSRDLRNGVADSMGPAQPLQGANRRNAQTSSTASRIRWPRVAITSLPSTSRRLNGPARPLRKRAPHMVRDRRINVAGSMDHGTVSQMRSTALDVTDSTALRCRYSQRRLLVTDSMALRCRCKCWRSSSVAYCRRFDGPA